MKHMTRSGKFEVIFMSLVKNKGVAFKTLNRFENCRLKIKKKKNRKVRRKNMIHKNLCIFFENTVCLHPSSLSRGDPS